MKTMPVILIGASLHFVGAGFADDRYEALVEEAWRPLHELQFDSRDETPPVAIPETVVEPGSEFLSLETLLDEVQRRNPSLESALNAWRAALAGYPQAKALEDPMLSYSVAPLTLDRPRADDGTNRIDQGHVVELSQSFPWPGKRRLRGEIALLDAKGARADLETIRQELIRETRMAYYEYWYAYRALEINAINQELLQELQNAAESKYAAGTVSKQDALQAEVEREHLVHQEIVLNRLRDVTQARINMLLNRAPESHLPPPPDYVDPPQRSPEVDALVDAAVRNRPELHALQRRFEARDADVDLARREFRPDFKVLTRYNSLWANDEQRFMVGAGVNIPIQFGKRRGAVAEARAERARLEANLAEKASEVAFEVKEAHQSLYENRHVVELYEGRLIPAAEENLEAAQSGYAAAEVDFLALITAQKLLMDTRLKRYEALASYHQAAADLDRAVGGAPHQAKPVSEGDAP